MDASIENEKHCGRGVVLAALACGLVVVSVIAIREHTTNQTLSHQIAVERKTDLADKNSLLTAKSELSTTQHALAQARASVLSDNQLLAAADQQLSSAPDVVLPDPATLTAALDNAFTSIGVGYPTQQQIASFISQEDALARAGYQVDPQADAEAFLNG